MMLQANTKLLVTSFFKLIISSYRALEQFHQLYQIGPSVDNQHRLEEIYVTGFRIIAFLTECLPKHPELSRAPLVQERSRAELKLLRKCLEDVALRIDEYVCNEFVDDGDFFLDAMIASQMEKDDSDEEKSCRTNKEIPSRVETWVELDDLKKFEQRRTHDSQNKQNERKLSESPTSETVGTSGTGSIESLDSRDLKDRQFLGGNSPYAGYQETDEDYFGDVERVCREDKLEIDDLSELEDLSISSYSSQPFTLSRKTVSLDFLKTIAREPVLYETDSEAADSWANSVNDTKNPKARPCLPSSSGVTPTSDPARIAFRNLMNKLPHKTILQRDSNSGLSDHRASSQLSRKLKEDRVSTEIPSLDDHSLDEVVEHEIQEFLDKKLGKLAQKASKHYRNRKNSHLKRKIRNQTGKSSKMSLNEHSPSSSNHQRRRKQNQKRSVSFDDSSYISSSSSSISSLGEKTGSKNTAFSSYNRIKQTGTSKHTKPQGKHIAPESLLVQDDWISFDNFTGGNFFDNTFA